MGLILIPYVGGIICAVAVLWIFRTRFCVRTFRNCALFVTILAGVGFGGAKVLYILENIQHTLRDGISLAGLSMFGGVLLVPVVMPLFAKPFSMTVEQIMDASAPCGAIILGFMRISCFISGCCGAKPLYLAGEIIVLPVQLIEALFDFLLAAFLIKSERYGARQGQGFYVAMVGYSVIRFFLEFLRDTEQINGFLSRGQWLSILTMTIGLAMFGSVQTAQRKKVTTKQKGRK